MCLAGGLCFSCHVWPHLHGWPLGVPAGHSHHQLVCVCLGAGAIREGVLRQIHLPVSRCCGIAGSEFRVSGAVSSRQQRVGVKPGALLLLAADLDRELALKQGSLKLLLGFVHAACGDVGLPDEGLASGRRAFSRLNPSSWGILREGCCWSQGDFCCCSFTFSSRFPATKRHRA